VAARMAERFGENLKGRGEICGQGDVGRECVVGSVGSLDCVGWSVDTVVECNVVDGGADGGRCHWRRQMGWTGKAICTRG
jgi:hypothetical protein